MTQDAELAENTKIYQQRFIQLLLCEVLLVAAIGSFVSKWFTIGAATIYVVLKVFVFVSEALLFKRGLILSFLAFLVHLPLVMIVSYAASAPGIDQGFEFFLGILVILPTTLITALVYRRR